jgi:hypothetical protein
MSATMLNTFQQGSHAMLPEATHDEAARQEFTKSLKQFIQQGLLPGLTPVYKGRVIKGFEKEHGREPKDRREIRSGMVKDPYFQHYAAANRIAQELLWESANISIDRQLPELIEKAKALSAKSPSKLDLPKDFETPHYVTALDIHCMPGGYATEVTEDDVSVGVLYDRGVYLYAMGYMGPLNDDMGRSVCNYVKRKLNGFCPKRILDLGCTVGHATLPFKEPGSLRPRPSGGAGLRRQLRPDERGEDQLPRRSFRPDRQPHPPARDLRQGHAKYLQGMFAPPCPRRLHDPRRSAPIRPDGPLHSVHPRQRDLVQQ